MRASLLLLFSLPLAGCHTAAIDAPSLAPRPEEARPILPPDEQPREAAAAADPALPGRIAPIVAAAEAGHRAFLRQQGEVDRLAAAAARGGKGGEAWLSAQQALSALGAAQDPIRQAAVSLDALRGDPAAASAASRALIDAAAAHLQALEDAEARAYAGLAARLD